MWRDQQQVAREVGSEAVATRGGGRRSSGAVADEASGELRPAWAEEACRSRALKPVAAVPFPPPLKPVASLRCCKYDFKILQLLSLDVLFVF